MINDWLSERGRAAIERMGWPEWEQPDQFGPQNCKMHAIGDKLGINVTSHGVVYYHDISLSDYEALALLRDKAIAYLVGKGCSVFLSPIGCRVMQDGKIIAQDTDIDACLIAAVLEVGQ